MKLLIVLPGKTKSLTVDQDKSDSIGNLKEKIEKTLKDDDIKEQDIILTPPPETKLTPPKTSIIKKKKKVTPQIEKGFLTLSYKGTILADDKKIEDYGIQENDLIDLSSSKLPVQSSVCIYLDNYLGKRCEKRVN